MFPSSVRIASWPPFESETAGIPSDGAAMVKPESESMLSNVRPMRLGADTESETFASFEKRHSLAP